MLEYSQFLSALLFFLGSAKINIFALANGNDHSGFAIYDIIRNRTSLIPVIAYEAVPPRNEPCRWYVPGGEAMIMRDFEGNDCFSLYPLISAALEGPLDFRRITKTSIIPPYRFEAPVWEGRKVELHGLPKVMLWKQEEQAGEILLRARKISGLVKLPDGMIEDNVNS